VEFNGLAEVLKDWNFREKGRERRREREQRRQIDAKAKDNIIKKRERERDVTVMSTRKPVPTTKLL